MAPGKLCASLVLLFAAIVCPAQGGCKHRHEFSSAQKALLHHLLDDYGEPTVRPVRNHSDIVDVYLSLKFKRMVSFEQNEQQLTVIANVQLEWKDEYLVWDPAEHVNVSRLYVPIDKIWKLDLTLYSTVSQAALEMDHDIAYVTSEGLITWFSSTVLVSSCLVRVRYFPFDKQYCRLIIASWTFDNGSIHLIKSGENHVVDNFVQNGVWELASAEVMMQPIQWPCCPNAYEEIHYLLIFTRQSRYYVITVIVPSATLSLVSLLVFFMPPYSEEKVTLASSNLLAMLLFQELVSTSMPPIGTEFPLIGSFFVASIIINTFSIFTSILIMHIHKKHNKPVPMWLERLFFLETGLNQSKPSAISPKWIVRRLPGLNWTSSVSGGVATHHHQKIAQKGATLLSYAYREPAPPLSVIDEKEETRHEIDDAEQLRRGGTSESKTINGKEDYSKDWQALALKVNRLVAFLLTTGMIVTASVIVFLYVNQVEEDFPVRT